MKPLKIEIEGINSFVSKQTVDFKKLSERGLFGIFGKTGSGKSTILDAIYLALYGQIIRTKKMFDIINLQCDKGTVKLTFSADYNESDGIFYVERQIERAPERKVTIKANLFETNEKQTYKNLIATGDDEVTKKVEEIIGFGAEEFKQCIALPQGEYAHFLKESANNKVNTIAKIFKLDKYGSSLFEKTKNELIESENRLAFINGVLSEYGDISEKDLAFTKKEIDATKIELQKTAKEFDKIKNDYLAKQKDEIVETQKNEAKAKLDKICENLEEIETSKKTLNILKLSHKIAPTYAYMEAAKQAVETTSTKISSVNDALKKASIERIEIENESGEQKTKSYLNLTSYELNKKLLSEAINNKHKLKRAEARKLNLIESLNSNKKLLKEKEQKNNAVTLEIEKLNGELNRLNLNADNINVPLSVISDARHYEKIKSHIDIYGENQNTVELKLKEAREKRSRAYKNLENLDKELNNIKEDYNNIAKSIEEFYGSEISPEQSLSKCTEDYQKISIYGNNLIKILKQINKKNKDIELFNRAHLESLENEQNLKKELEEVIVEIRSLNDKHEKTLFTREKYFGENLIGFLKNEVNDGSICPICSNVVESKPVMQNEISLNNYDFELENIKNQLIEAHAKKEDIISKISSNKQNDVFISSELSKVQKEIASLTQEKNDIEIACPLLKNKNETEINNQINLSKIALTNLTELVKNLNEQNKLKLSKEKLCVKNSAFVEELDKEIEIYSNMHENNSASLAELNIESLKLEKEFGIDDISVKVKDYEAKKDEYEKINAKRNELVESILTKMQEKEKAEVSYVETLVEVRNYENLVLQTDSEIKDLQSKINTVKVDVSLEEDLKNITKKSDELKVKLEILNQKELKAVNIESKLKIEKANLLSNFAYKSEQLKQITEEYQNMLKLAGITEQDLILDANIEDIAKLETKIAKFEEDFSDAQANYRTLSKIMPSVLTSKQYIEETMNTTETKYITLSKKQDYLIEKLKGQEETLKKVKYFLGEKVALNEKIDTLKELHASIQGGKLVSFITEEYITRITEKANEILELLTNGRYQLVFDGDYVVADNQNGGSIRNINTLSGGETFLASFSIAIAIAQIMVEFKGKKLEFIFLDEGFGTLDNDCIDMVMVSLQKIKSENFVIGLIAHEDIIKNRVIRKIEVEKISGEIGSLVKMIV